MEVINAIKNDVTDFSKNPEALGITSKDDSDAVDDIIRMTFAKSQLWNPDSFKDESNHRTIKVTYIYAKFL